MSPPPTTKELDQLRRAARNENNPYVEPDLGMEHYDVVLRLLDEFEKSDKERLLLAQEVWHYRMRLKVSYELLEDARRERDASNTEAKRLRDLVIKLSTYVPEPVLDSLVPKEIKS